MNLLRDGRSIHYAVLVLAVLSIGIWAARLSSTIASGRFNITSGCEQISIFNISRMRHGEPAYNDCFSHPYRFSIFNRLFYSCYGAAASTTGVEEADLSTLLRLVTTAWAGMGCLTFFLFLRRFAHCRSGVVSALCLAIVAWFGPTIGWWTMTVRPDVASIALETAAVFLIVARWDRLTPAILVAAGVLFYLGWGFKQSAVTLLLGVLIALAWTRQWRSLMLLVAVFGTCVVAALAFEDKKYWDNVFVAPSLAPLTFKVGLSNLGSFAWAWGYVLLLAVPGLWRMSRGKSDDAFFVLAVVFAVSFSISLVGAARFGSSRNYYFPAWIVGVAAGGIALLQTSRRRSKESEADGAAPAGNEFLMITAVVVTGAVIYTALLFHPSKKFGNLSINEIALSKEMLESLQSDEKPVFCEESFHVRMALPKDGGGVPIIDYTIYDDAYRRGYIKDGGVVGHIERRHYTTIWLRDDSEWREVAGRAGYVAVKSVERWTKYKLPTR